MSEQSMPTGFGAFCWNQLNTPDPARSRAFYEGLLDWHIQEQSLGDMAMQVILRGNDMIGDLMVMPEGLKAPSHWLSYVWVQDIDSVVSKAIQLGAQLQLPITEIPEVGRIAVFLDPRGCQLGVYASGADPSLPQPGGPGTFCWYECATREVATERNFYGELFGWTAQESPMPGGFIYTLLHRGSEQVAGMMPMEGDIWAGIPDHWMPYVAVADLEATLARLPGLNGELCVPATDIGIGRFAVIKDPLGAAISLFQGA